MRAFARNFTVICLILMLACGAGLLYERICRVVEEKSNPLGYESTVNRYSSEYDIEPEIIYAVIKTESGFNPTAVSKAGAMGLMQIMPDTFEWLLTKTGEKYSVDALYDPDVNIRYGTYLLSILYDEFEVWDTVLAAYNAGIGRVRSWLDNPDHSAEGLLTNIPIAETDNYVQKVNNSIEIYRQLYFN